LKSKWTSSKAKKKDQKVLTSIRIDSDLMMICERNISVRYITHDSYAISVVPPFNRLWAQVSAVVLA